MWPPAGLGADDGEGTGTGEGALVGRGGGAHEDMETGANDRESFFDPLALPQSLREYRRRRARSPRAMPLGWRCDAPWASHTRSRVNCKQRHVVDVFIQRLFLFFFFQKLNDILFWRIDNSPKNGVQLEILWLSFSLGEGYESSRAGGRREDGDALVLGVRGGRAERGGIRVLQPRPQATPRRLEGPPRAEPAPRERGNIIIS